MPGSRRTLAVAVAIGALLAIWAIGVALGEDPRSALCPIEGNKVLVSFEIPHARDYNRHIPRMLRSPELETDAAAFIVLFDGPTRLTVVGAAPADDGAPIAEPPTTEEFAGVVCAVVDGHATVYVNVDITSWSRP